jgi:hypothetical protein
MLRTGLQSLLVRPVTEKLNRYQSAVALFDSVLATEH